MQDWNGILKPMNHNFLGVHLTYNQEYSNSPTFSEADAGWAGNHVA